MRALEWRYGDGLDWRLVTIGLREDTSSLVSSGTTPESRVNGWRWFAETFGMPLLTTPRARLVASGRMCRAVKAAGSPGGRCRSAGCCGAFGWRGSRRCSSSTRTRRSPRWRVRRARARPRAAGARPDGGRRRGRLRGRPRRGAVGSRDRRPCDRAGPRGALRRRRPLHRAEPRLSPRRPRRSSPAASSRSRPTTSASRTSPRIFRGAPPPEPLELLAEYPDGLTTVEVAQVCRGRNDPPDIAGTEAALVEPGRVGSDPAQRDRRCRRASGSPLPDRRSSWCGTAPRPGTPRAGSRPGRTSSSRPAGRERGRGRGAGAGRHRDRAGRCARRFSGRARRARRSPRRPRGAPAVTIDERLREIDAGPFEGPDRRRDRGRADGRAVPPMAIRDRPRVSGRRRDLRVGCRPRTVVLRRRSRPARDDARGDPRLAGPRARDGGDPRASTPAFTGGCGSTTATVRSSRSTSRRRGWSRSTSTRATSGSDPDVAWLGVRPKWTRIIRRACAAESLSPSSMFAALALPTPAFASLSIGSSRARPYTRSRRS